MAITPSHPSRQARVHGSASSTDRRAAAAAASGSWLQPRAPLFERQRPQVAVHPRHVEDVVALRSPAHLAVEDQLARRQRRHRAGNRRAVLRQPIPGIEANLASLLEGEQTDTVELALEDPVGAGEPILGQALPPSARSSRGIFSAAAVVLCASQQPRALNGSFAEALLRTTCSSRTTAFSIAFVKAAWRGLRRLDETLKRRVAMKAIRVEHRLDSSPKLASCVMRASFHCSPLEHLPRLHFIECDDRDWLVMS